MASAPLGITDPVVQANAKALAQNRNVQYKYASNVADAILGNLGTTSAGIGRTLTAENAKQAAAITQMMARNTALARNGVAGVTQFAGSMGLGKQNPILAQGQARAAALTGAGMTEAASTTSQAGRETSSLMQQQIAGMGQASQQELIDALSARAQADTKTLLDEQFQVYQTQQAHQDTQFNVRAEILNKAAASGQYTQQQMQAMGQSLGAGLSPEYQASLQMIAANTPSETTKFDNIAKTVMTGDIMNVLAGIAKGSPVDLGTGPIGDWQAFVDFLSKSPVTATYSPTEQNALMEYAWEKWSTQWSILLQQPGTHVPGGGTSGSGGGGGIGSGGPKGTPGQKTPIPGSYGGQG